MRNKNIKSLLLEVITEKYGKIEFVENSLVQKNHLIWPFVQEHHDPNSELMCLLSTCFVEPNLKTERFQLAFEYGIVQNPLKTIYLEFDTTDFQNYELNYVKEIKDFANDCGIIHNTGMGPIGYKGKQIEGYTFWQELWKGEELYLDIRKAVKKYLLEELDKGKRKI